MTKYQFDGQEIEARTTEDLVSQMHAQSRSPCKDDQDYMRSIADRLVVQSSLDVRYDTADNFVEDLTKYGVLTVDESEHSDGFPHLDADLRKK